MVSASQKDYLAFKRAESIVLLMAGARARRVKGGGAALRPGPRHAQYVERGCDWNLGVVAAGLEGWGPGADGSGAEEPSLGPGLGPGSRTQGLPSSQEETASKNTLGNLFFLFLFYLISG